VKILLAYVREMAHGLSYEEIHIRPALCRLGHNVSVFNTVNRDINVDNGEIKSIDGSFIRAIDLFKPDLVISTLYRDTLRPETFKYLTGQTRTTTVIISGDDEKNFNTVSSRFSPYVNYIITTYKPAIEWHKKLTENVIFAPYHANEKTFKRYKADRFIDASYCGLKSECREIALTKVAMSGIRIKVYGNGWSNDSCLKDVIDWVALINATKVNISLSTDIVDGKKCLQVKGRDFEIPMAGGFLLTQYNEELKPLYKFGKEIETYQSIDDLITKAKYYITHDRERERIALAGHKRARREHTTICRWRQILKQVKLKTL
jgi:spore maturation protein CgeB